jgi:hypothetical protein
MGEEDMTIVVWDGETLATDMQANDGMQKWKSEKAWYIGKDFDEVQIVSGVGILQDIIRLREWYKTGSSEDKFPIAFGSHRVTPTAKLIVVTELEGLLLYDGIPHPIEYGFKPCAFGEGKDFALGALSMGATSAQAVNVANEHSLHCGKGVTELTLKVKKH